ncbi:hypothetical protein D3C73_892350 [compost metagenome]
MILIVDLVGPVACRIFCFTLAEDIIVRIIVRVIRIEIHPVIEKTIQVVEPGVEAGRHPLSGTSSCVSAWSKTIGLVDVVGVYIDSILALGVHFGHLGIYGIFLIGTYSPRELAKI